MSSAEGVRELLGFEVQERSNDALLIRNMRLMEQVRVVRPATAEELQMFKVILGLTRRLEEVTVTTSATPPNDEEPRDAAIRTMGSSLQVANARIQDLVKANHGLGEALEAKEQELTKANVRADDAEKMVATLEAQCNAKQDLIEGLYKALNEVRTDLYQARAKAKKAKGKKDKR